MYSVVSPNPKNYTNKNQKGNVEYGIEKLAINKLTKYYAAELGQYQIEVNNLIPGAFPNPKIIKRYPKFINNLKKNSALKKIGYPDDLITSILFLSSKYTRFITGTDIVIDGGWTVF
jgi:NAD(P)-dependent dehydrogenase (short-subunit alcohol dehydrogenase family)